MPGNTDAAAPGRRAAPAVTSPPGGGGPGDRARRPTARVRPRPRARTLVLALLVPLLATHSSVAPAAPLQPWTGGPTPPLALRDLDGRERPLEAMRRRVVVVNFWATWCAPCVQEMPSLQRLRDRYRDRGLEVVAVNYQENAARIRPFLERNGLDLTVVRDHDGSARTAWRVTVFPTTYVIAPDGTIAYVVVGEADWSAAPIEPAVRRLLPPAVAVASSATRLPPSVPISGPDPSL